MHEVSWRRVKWSRPSWVRKDLLSVCGIVLGSIAVSRQYLLACCGGLLEASSAPLGGPLGARSSRGCFWLSEQPLEPLVLLAPPGQPLGRLQSRSLPKSQNSSTVQRFSKFFGPPGAHLAPPEALLGFSWRPLGPSWRLLGGLSGVGRLLGGSWPAQVGPGWSLGGP